MHDASEPAVAIPLYCFAGYDCSDRSAHRTGNCPGRCTRCSTAGCRAKPGAYGVGAWFSSDGVGVRVFIGTVNSFVRHGRTPNVEK